MISTAHQLIGMNIVDGIKEYGIRNAAQTTIAPTGTIGTVAGCEGYGCEPVFALAYTRHVNDDGQDLELTYASPLFEKALINAGLDRENVDAIIEKVKNRGFLSEISKRFPRKFGVYLLFQWISPQKNMSACRPLCKHLWIIPSPKRSISPGTRRSRRYCIRLLFRPGNQGCKGITVYVTGSREQEVLQTHSQTAEDVREMVTPAMPETNIPIWIKESDAEEPLFINRTKKPRPRFLPGFTFGVETPVGKTFVTVNENGNSQPFEVFINTAKAGSDVAADGEAIGRLISYILRLSSPVEPIERHSGNLAPDVRPWRRPTDGFRPQPCRSMPDGLAQVLAEYIESRADRLSQGRTAVCGPIDGRRKTDTRRIR